MSFWDNFTSLCQQKGLKPTVVIESLGFSSGNIGRWKTGGGVNSNVLLKISDEFDVSVDFLLKGKDFSAESDAENGVSHEELELIKMFRVLPDATQRFVFNAVKQGYEDELEKSAVEKRLLS